MYIDATISKQMKECERRNRLGVNSFRRIGDTNIFKNYEGRKIERVTVDGSITFRQVKGE